MLLNYNIQGVRISEKEQLNNISFGNQDNNIPEYEIAMIKKLKKVEIPKLNMSVSGEN